MELQEMMLMAARTKMRFQSGKGLIAFEDLFDLPLTSTKGAANLNDVAKVINKELKDSGEEDFVTPSSTGDQTLRVKLELVKSVISLKQKERDDIRDAQARREKKDKILSILQGKEDQALTEMSPEDLRKMVAEL